MLHLRYLGLIGLALAVVACGEDSANDSGAAGTSTGNGGAGGAGTGGGGGSAPEGTQVVTRSRSGMPAAGVSVVAHDASGAVVAQAQTDAAGEALLDVPDGGGGVDRSLHHDAPGRPCHLGDGAVAKR
mgnify:CR=1 FL=1